MALFCGIVILYLVSLSHQVCWNDLGNDLDPKLLGWVAEQTKWSRDSFLISGHSLIDPLMMLLFGAQGETRAQLAKALELQPQLVAKLNTSLCKPNEDEYHKASKLFLGKQYKPDVFYEQEIKKVLGSEVGNVDFSNQTAAAKTINDWVRAKTHNLVKYVVSPGELSRKTTAFIANAFSLSSPWLTPFDAKNTKDDYFYTAVEVPFMNVEELMYVRHIPSMDAKAVYIPLEKVELLGWSITYMVLVLPNKPDGLPKVLDKLSQNENIQGPGRWYNAVLSIPKFDIETTTELNGFLKSLGVKDIFTSKSELPDVTEKHAKIVIDQIIQNSHIKIDEKGVNAAAANANGGNSPKKPSKSELIRIVMKMDHGFYYGFTENYESPKIMFGGVYRGPQSVRPMNLVL